MRKNDAYQKQIDSEATGRFNSEVIAKSKTQEDFAGELKKVFADPLNSASSRNLQAYADQVQGMFEDPLTKNKSIHI